MTVINPIGQPDLKLHENQAIQPEDFAVAYQPGLTATIRFVRSLGASPDIAEEIAQAAWARGWQHRAELRNPLAIGAWVNSIARNLYLSHLNSASKLEDLQDVATTRTPFHNMVASELIELCSGDQSNILKMFYFDGYTTLEIAEMQKMCPVTVRVRLMRLRRQLRVVLSETSKAA